MFFIFVFLLSFIYINTSKNKVDTNFSDSVVISDVKCRSEYNTYYCVCRDNKYIFNTSETYNIGEVLYIEGELRTPNDKSYPTNFSYKNYLRTKNVYYIISIKHIKQSNGFSFYLLRGYLYNHYKNVLDESSFSYLSSLIFGSSNFDDDIKQSINKLGISYIFAISGLHVMFLVYLLERFLRDKLYIKSYNIIIIIVLAFYLYLANFTVSFLRVFILYILRLIKNKFNIDLSNIDLLSITAMLLLIYNPYMICSLGFVLSFLISLVIMLSSKILTKNKRYITYYKIGFISFLYSMPFVVNATNGINLYTVFVGPLFVLLFEVLIYPITLFMLFFTKMSYIFKYVYSTYNNLIALFSKSDLLTVHMRHFTIFSGAVYYVLLYFISLRFEIKKKCSLLCIMLITYLIILTSLSSITLTSKVEFINCMQGDATYISTTSGVRVLIDAQKGSYNYLENNNIRHIDYLILTHSHEDHIFDALEIIQNIDVSIVILSKFDNKSTLKDIIYYANKVEYFRQGSSIKEKDITIDFIGPFKNNSNLNNISLCFIVKIKNTKLMFTGDAEAEEEADIIAYYDKYISSDIYQVGHHGSNTSSTKDFLFYLRPKDSIISCSQYNREGFPSKSVLSRLKNSNVYITYRDKNISCYIYNNSYKIKTYKNSRKIMII